MSRTIKEATPDQLGYKDRGIVKWLGMMLSDHSEALKKEELNNQLLDIAPKEWMTEEDISYVLYQAFKGDLPIFIQANVLHDGKYFKDLECKVVGYLENEICLVLKDGRRTRCTFNQIRNVAFMNPLEWYDKRMN